MRAPCCSLLMRSSARPASRKTRRARPILGRRRCWRVESWSDRRLRITSRYSDQATAPALQHQPAEVELLLRRRCRGGRRPRGSGTGMCPHQLAFCTGAAKQLRSPSKQQPPMPMPMPNCLLDALDALQLARAKGPGSGRQRRTGAPRSPWVRIAAPRGLWDLRNKIAC